MMNRDEEVWRLECRLKDLRDVLDARLQQVSVELARARERILALEREKARTQQAMPGSWPELHGHC